MEEIINDNTNRAEWAIGLMLATIIATISDISVFLFNTSFLGFDYPFFDLHRKSIINILHIASFIAFILWFCRACYNLNQISSNFTYADGWAVGCWLIPFVGVYLPCKIMRKLYIETKKTINSNKISKQIHLPLINVGLWWTFFFLRLFAISISKLEKGVYSLFIAYFFRILYLLITIKLIKDYSKIEPLLANCKVEKPEPEKGINNENDTPTWLF